MLAGGLIIVVRTSWGLCDEVDDDLAMLVDEYDATRGLCVAA